MQNRIVLDATQSLLWEGHVGRTEEAGRTDRLLEQELERLEQAIDQVHQERDRRQRQQLGRANQIVEHLLDAHKVEKPAGKVIVKLQPTRLEDGTYSLVLEWGEPTPAQQPAAEPAPKVMEKRARPLRGGKKAKRAG